MINRRTDPLLYKIDRFHVAVRQFKLVQKLIKEDIKTRSQQFNDMPHVPLFVLATTDVYCGQLLTRRKPTKNGFVK